MEQRKNRTTRRNEQRFANTFYKAIKLIKELGGTAVDLIQREFQFETIRAANLALRKLKDEFPDSVIKRDHKTISLISIEEL